MLPGDKLVPIGTMNGAKPSGINQWSNQSDMVTLSVKESGERSNYIVTIKAAGGMLTRHGLEVGPRPFLL